jgi:hypothetical protein
LRITLEEPRREFNQALNESIDEVLSELLGPAVLKSFYVSLETYHAITRDELPYRLDTAYAVLEQVFGVKGARTIGMRFAQRLYQKFHLPFAPDDGYTTLEYFDAAKKKLGER